MDKLKLTTYKDEMYSIPNGSPITVQINPQTLDWQKGIQYKEEKQMGSPENTSKFDRYGEETLSFEIQIDCTGVIPYGNPTDTAYDKVKDLENSLYTYKGNIHRPAYVVITWGSSIFKGQLKTFNTNYTLFNSSGQPLRAKVHLAFSHFISEKEKQKKASKSSPDMSHLITVQEGDTLANLCQQIYGNSLLLDEVARINNLGTFRQLQPGTTLLFPHLKKQ